MRAHLVAHAVNGVIPLQLGEVELPGWIYYLEPRGDRLFALGFDNSNQEGSMNVSLFNVAAVATPPHSR